MKKTITGKRTVPAPERPLSRFPQAASLNFDREILGPSSTELHQYITSEVRNLLAFHNDNVYDALVHYIDELFNKGYINKDESAALKKLCLIVINFKFKKTPVERFKTDIGGLHEQVNFNPRYNSSVIGLIKNINELSNPSPSGQLRISISTNPAVVYGGLIGGIVGLGAGALFGGFGSGLGWDVGGAIGSFIGMIVGGIVGACA